MPKKLIVLFFIVFFVNLFNSQISLAKDVILESGTRIPLELADNVSSGVNNEGDQINFIVTEDIKLEDTVLIKEGTRATGIISELSPRGRIGKAGNMTITFDYAKAVNGKKVPLTGMITKKGEEKIILSAALSFLLTPFCLLIRGTDARFPANYPVIARVDRDTIISLDDNIIPVNNKH